MGRSQDSFSKKEKEKKRLKKRKEKQERREQRKQEKAERGKLSFEDQLMYVDENGKLTKTPPDPNRKKTEVKAEDIVVGVPKKEDVELDPHRKGVVKFFNGDKGYGFIIDAETKESLFVHANNLLDPIQDNDKVEFEVEMGPKGPNAVRVKII